MSHQQTTSAPKPPPGIDAIAPAESMASPCQSQSSDEKDAPFWRPSWVDGLWHMGWRWILFVPAPLLLVGAVASVYWPLAGLRLWGLGKPLLLLLILPFTVLRRTMHTAVQRRKEPFCIHCGYGLSGLPDDYKCPECGRHYTLAMIDEYRRDPEFFVRRWRSRWAVPTADVPFAAGNSNGPRRRSRDGT